MTPPQASGLPGPKYRDGSGVNRPIKRNGRTKGGAELAVKVAIKLLESEFNQQAKLLAGELSAEEPEFTVADLTSAWLESRRPAPVKIDETKQAGSAPTDGLTQQTFDQYEANLRLHVLPVLGDKPVATLSTPSCEKAIHGLYNKATGTGYRTAALSRQIMQQVFDYAIREGYRTDNPIRSVSRIPKKRKNPQAMRAATVAAVHHEKPAPRQAIAGCDVRFTSTEPPVRTRTGRRRPPVLGVEPVGYGVTSVRARMADR